jgi:hypothetical protein
MPKVQVVGARFWAQTFACLVTSAAVVVACSAWEIPSKRCRATAFSGEDAAVPSAATAPCAACVNAPCCDEVGRCDETSGCNEHVRATRSCLLAAGASAGKEEAACRQKLDGDPRATSTYACMRGKCGAQCQIPACDVDRAATAVVNGRCDRCVTASCCPQINTCYGDRACKLVLECIFGRCGPDLGQELLRDELNGPRPNPCRTSAIDAGGDSGIADFNGCISACISDFGLGQPDFEAACHAFEVFQCAAGAKCGSECEVRDAGARSDAGDADIPDGPKD